MDEVRVDVAELEMGKETESLAMTEEDEKEEDEDDEEEDTREEEEETEKGEVRFAGVIKGCFKSAIAFGRLRGSRCKHN